MIRRGKERFLNRDSYLKGSFDILANPLLTYKEGIKTYAYS